MKRVSVILISLLCAWGGQAQRPIEQTIFAFGGEINKKLVGYVVDLTGKSDPKICFVPTASADGQDNISYWDSICKQLSIESNVLKVWVSSNERAESFEEILLNMDAIVVGGGNTLNMMGIWQAQGIDTLLRKALDQGIILAGGSAGSICWFRNGISDSRPVHLSVVDGLSFLPYSHCPHYADSSRKALYHQQIRRGEMAPGYALDDLAGILFRNGEFVEAVSQNDVNHAWFVGLRDGEIHSEKLPARILVGRDALPESAYHAIPIGKRASDFPEMNDQHTPLNAYVSLAYILANGRLSEIKMLSSRSLWERMGDDDDREVSEDQKNSTLAREIDRVLLYNDSLAGVVTDYKDFYSLWFFYKENGQWLSAGEDFGGYSALEAEITFREKASMHMKKIQE